MRLIAVAFVKNEAWIIDRWLERTSEFADGIIVLDGGSTDGTLEKLRAHKRVIEIIEQKPGTALRERDDRNALVDAARRHGAEWVMFIDADEIMDARLAGNLDTLLADPAVGRIFFREVTLWRGLTHYRADKPEQYGRDTATNQIVRMTPDLRWYIAGVQGIRARLRRSLKIRRFVPKPQSALRTTLGGVHGTTLKATHLMRLHYHFVDWDRTWRIHMRYALRDCIDMRRQLGEIDEVAQLFASRMDEAGLQLEPVRPEWGVL